MGFRHNNVLHANHFRKDWQLRVKTWFDQPGRKKRRRIARQKKVEKSGGKPVELLRPAVRCPTVKYNTRLRVGRGFTLEELKAAGITKHYAPTVGIPVDARRKNRSEESLARNVERLKLYQSHLVLLPKKKGISKRAPKGSKTAKESGEAMDVDLEKTVKKVNRELAILETTSGLGRIEREEPRAITAEEREVEAFKSLRKARSDARLVGVRKIRAQKKEEEEAAKKK